MKILVGFMVLFLIPFISFAYNIGQVVEYGGKNYKISNINKQQETLLLCPYHNNKGFFTSQSRGWFFGGDKCFTIAIKTLRRKKNEKQEYRLLQLAQNPRYLNSLTADEFKKMFDNVTKIAVMHPTQEAIKSYTYMTNFTRLKSLIFAHQVVDYTLRNPKYDMVKTMGSTSWSYYKYAAVKEQKIKRMIQTHNNRIGLFAFVKNGCPYCEEELHVLEWLKTDYSMEVVLVSMNSCPKTSLPCTVKPEAFTFYNIHYEPTTILVIKQDNGKPKYYPIGVGLTDEQTMLNRIFYYLKAYYNGDEYNDKNFIKLLAGGK